MRASDQQNAESLSRSISAEINAKERELGRKLNAEERQPIIDNYALQWEVVTPGMFYGTNVDEVNIDDIPTDKLSEIEQALRAAGEPVNFRNIQAVYSEMMQRE